MSQIKNIFKRFGLRIHKVKEIPIEKYIELYGEESVKNKRFYNIGAGLFRHKCWTNIDHKSKHYNKIHTDIDWDITGSSEFPVKNDSAEIFYLCHVIEHIPNEYIIKLFKSIYSALKKGGYLRVVIPDMDMYYESYKRNDYSVFEEPKWKGISIHQLFLYSFAGQLSVLNKDKRVEPINDTEIQENFKSLEKEDFFNYFTNKCELLIQKDHPGEHINWWNKEKLFKFLKEAGFKEVYVSAYSKSQCPVLRDKHHFDTSFPEISLYVEVKK